MARFCFFIDLAGFYQDVNGTQGVHNESDGYSSNNDEPATCINHVTRINSMFTLLLASTKAMICII